MLVWCKRPVNKLGKFLSDCEVAWMNKGHGVYLFHHVWDGFNRESERHQRTLHPTQKPVALMRWVLDRLKIPKGAIVLDPYMGSGTTGVACVQTGRKFVGIELDPAYFDVAKKRIADARKELRVAA